MAPKTSRLPAAAEQPAARPTDEPARTERRILRRAEVEQKTGFKRAHIYSLMREGRFPKALRLGIRAVGWDAAEIDAWIAERLQNRV